MKQTFRRLILWALCLVMLCALIPGAGAESPALKLTEYGSCSDVPELLEAAEKALEAGVDPKQVREEMNALADANGFLYGLMYTAENIAAADSELTQKIRAICDSESKNRRLVTEAEDVQKEENNGGISPYELPDVSDAMKEMLADKGAQFCLRPYVWPEAAFKEAFGVQWKKFKPSRPRPGYICVVLTGNSESSPGTPWQDDDADLSVLTDAMQALQNWSGDNCPVFTGNPNLASAFLVFDITYPFRGYYGSSMEDAVKGYNCKLTMTLTESPAGKAVSELSQTNVLGDTIYEWDNYIAKADAPVLYETEGFEGFMKKLTSLVATGRASQTANRAITSLNAESVLNSILLQEAGNAKDAWQKAIYESGAQNVRLEEDALSFSLRSWQPDVKGLGAYAAAENGEAWLNAALENASKYDLEISLPLQEGQVGKAAMNQLKSAVQKAAGSAKQGFSGKDFLQALKDLMFPAVTEGQVKAAEDLTNPENRSAAFRAWLTAMGENDVPDNAWAALMATRKNQALDVSKGPHEMVLNCTDSADPAALLSGASDAALDVLAWLPAAQRPDGADLENLLAEKLAAKATDKKNQGKIKNALKLDLDELKDRGFPASYRALLSGFTWADAVDALKTSAGMLPEEAAQEMPKTGWVSGSRKGTRVNIKIAADGDPTYFIMRSADTDEIAVAAFIHPGKTAQVNVPAGQYNLAWCSGKWWFGEKTLFGQLGSYNKSENTEIKGGNFYHTFTLKAVEKGTVSFWSGDPSDFQ